MDCLNDKPNLTLLTSPVGSAEVTSIDGHWSVTVGHIALIAFVCLWIFKKEDEGVGGTRNWIVKLIKKLQCSNVHYHRHHHHRIIIDQNPSAQSKVHSQ